MVLTCLFGSPDPISSFGKEEVEVIIYDLFEVVYYDLIYGTGLWRTAIRASL